MRRAVVLAASSAAVILATPASAGAATVTWNTTYFNYYFKLLDNAPLQSSATQAASAGDVVLIKSKYYMGRRVVAWEHTACTIVDWPRAVCTISIVGPGGQLTLSGQFSATSRGNQKIPVVGGTGAYRDARGDVTFRQTSETRGTARFSIIT